MYHIGPSLFEFMVLKNIGDDIFQSIGWKITKIVSIAGSVAMEKINKKYHDINELINLQPLCDPALIRHLFPVIVT